MFLKKVPWNISKNSQENICAGVTSLRVTNNFINEEIFAQCFPKPLTIFAKSSIVDFLTQFLLPHNLRPIYKNFLLWKWVIKLLPCYATTISSLSKGIKLNNRATLVKSTLIQICKFHYMLGSIWKQYPENIASLNLRILELFTPEVCFFS